MTDSPLRHPSTKYWSFPDPARALPSQLDSATREGTGSDQAAGLQRTNLRELAARPDRFEHHLVVLGRAGDAQLEMATASEPLYFAHANISDEYAIPVHSGDQLFDSLPFRTFFTDRERSVDVGRVNHQSWDLILHPHGYLHWPGRLRAPFTPPRFPNDERRTGVSLVYCGYRPHPPHPDRPLRVSPTREGASKSYVAHEPPFHLIDLKQDEAQVVGRVATSTLELLVAPGRIDAPRGGYAFIISADGPIHAESDLLYLPPGSAISGAGIQRALWFSDAEHDAEPPPESWLSPPEPDFAPYEAAAPGQLPLDLSRLLGGEFKAEALTDELVRLSIDGVSAEVPRYWLARFLFRLGLHAYQIGYLETYGGFFYDDQGGHRLGLRGAAHNAEDATASAVSRAGGGGGELRMNLDQMRQVVEILYRAVAPTGYVEHI